MLKDAIASIAVIVLIMVLFSWQVSNGYTRLLAVTPLQIIVMVSLIPFIGFSAQERMLLKT